MSRAAPLLGVLLLGVSVTADAAELVVRATQRDARPLVGAVVMVEADSPALPPAAPRQAVMDQVDLAFVPDVLVLPVRSTVQFPNSDAVSHQVYSFSAARQFQLPLYRGKAYPPVAFDEPGLVTLGCNIHDKMLAYIVVTAAPFFGRTDAAGIWSAEVPAGRYRVRVWHPLQSGADLLQSVETGPVARTLEIRLTRALRPAPLEGRPHSWDY